MMVFCSKVVPFEYDHFWYIMFDFMGGKMSPFFSPPFFFSPMATIFRGILKIHRRWLVQTYRCRAIPSLPRAGPIGVGNAMGGTMEMEQWKWKMPTGVVT